VIFVRDLAAMRRFYEEVMEFPLLRELSPGWIEYRIGSTTLALAMPGGLFDDPPPPEGALSCQMAFRVAPDQVKACAEDLERKGVSVDGPTDRSIGHRTLFFRDPDGNVLEIYAEI
jgi:lactoylglutathione lyase